MGSYSQSRLMPAEFVLALPDDIDYQTAAAMMVKGMAAQYLIVPALMLSQMIQFLFKLLQVALVLFCVSGQSI